MVSTLLGWWRMAWRGESEQELRSAAHLAGLARVLSERRRELTPEEERVRARILARWRVAEAQARRKRMERVA